MINAAAGRRFNFMIGVICIFCPIEKEIVGTGTRLLAFITDIRRLFEKGAYFWRKALTVKRTALAAAFGAIGLAVWASTEAFHRAGAKLFTFRTFSAVSVIS